MIIKRDLISINRHLSDLDIFTLDFVDVLKRYTEYVIISGYVSILLGRARVSEDVDIIVPKIDSKRFYALHQDLIENGYYCLNTSRVDEAYDMLSSGLAIRFAKKDTVIPNIELKFSKNKIDEISLKRKIKVLINSRELTISHLELQIAFKEKVLKSPKDMEDAAHIREVAKQHLNHALIKRYEEMLNEFY